MRLIFNVKRSFKNALCFSTFLVFLLLMPSYVFAGLQAIPSIYGILPADMAMAGARTAGFPDADAAYYNPAALADADSTSLSVGYLYSQPFFKGGIVGKEERFSEANRAVSFCAVSDFGRIFTKHYPVATAVAVIIDDNMQKLVNFEGRYYENGKFIRYGIRDISLSHGWGFRLFNGFNLGAGFILGYTTSVISDQEVQIAGDIQNEQITFVSKPAIAPVFGLQWLDKKFRLGFVYRGERLNLIAPVGGKSTIRADDFVLKSFENSMEFKDGFEPQQVALGLIYDIRSKILVSVQAEWLNWDRFDEYIPVWDVNGQDFDIRTEDIYQPRLGVLLKPKSNLEVGGGYAYEPSPFKRLGRFNNLVLDNARHRLTAGAGYSIHPSFLLAPLSFDLAIVSLYLVPRDYVTADQKMLHSEGYMIGGSASFTIRF